MEDQDAVIAMTCGTRNMQGVMNLVWDKLLPAMQPKRLKADKAAHKKLEAKLASLTVRPPQSSGSPRAFAQSSGQRFTFATNDLDLEVVALELGGNGEVSLAMRCNGVEQCVVCGGIGEWKKGRMTYAAQAEQPVAISGAWTADGTCSAKFCFYKTPFVITAKLQLSGEHLLYDSETNVGFGQTKQPQLVGRAQ